jgi:hypothetical protein
MSLNWSIDKIHDYKELCWRPALDDQGNPILDEDGDPQVRLEPITDCLIWGTMCVEIGKITEQNADEFHRRLEEADEVGIAPSINFFNEATQKWDRRIPTLEEVKAHIGLSTNVYTGRSKNPGIRAFNKRIKRARKELDKANEVFPEDHDPNMKAVVA